MKTLFFLMPIALIIGACKPERVINHKLDGEWTLTLSNNQAVPSNYSEIVKFSKKKCGGEVTTTVVLNGQVSTSTGTYSIMKRETITFAFPTGISTGYPFNTSIFNINESTKTTLKLTNKSDGQVFIYTKN
jgi:hypothetical protein